MIDKNSPIPVYFQLKNEISSKIANGLWKPGQCISSERELCEIYGVSRMTIRQALGELVQEGILLKIKGKGTFVCDEPIKQQDMMSFTEIIKQTGKSLRSEVLDFEIIDSPEEYRNILIQEKLYKIKRKRIVSNECIALETVYIPIEYCGNLTEKMLEKSLFKILEERGIFVDYSKSSIASIIMDDELKNTFELDSDIPLLKIISETYDSNNKIIFLEEAIYRSDKFLLQVKISRREGKIR